MIPKINLKKLKLAYRVHKDNARAKGVGFHLSFQDWLNIWIESGHLYERGNSKGKYVMARFGDNGPYAIGNVKIITREENLAEVSNETKLKGYKKISEFQTGQVRSPKTRAAMSVAKKGVPHTPKARLNMSLGHKGKPLSEAQYQACKPYWDSCKGRKRDPAIGRKISKAKKGNTHISLEQRAQISKTLTGRKPSAETVAKRSISLKAAWARRKAAAAQK